ncbi:excalibur calcium-binding domain-containing protein [Candidatus Daviesbacteria bacterium]|nr:excalibur calcium-binding domain-containing protein [Candidatus Daviesbacteria bacterium]
MKRIKIALFALLLSIAVFVFNPGLTLAQQGCCSWHGGISYCDSSVGTYVCNDGTYSPSCGCYKALPPTPTFPQMNATWNFSANTNGTYDVKVDLDDSNPSRYSVVLSKILGGDPGPLVDYTSPAFTFKNIYPGTWYMNTKKDINNTWSTVAYWKIIVPEWIAPTPMPIPITTPPPIAVTPNSNESLLSSFFQWLFNRNKSENIAAPTSTPTPKQAPYKCNCAKTCTQISTCAEAYYQLNTCGCSVRDGDDDGIPCESLCN